MSRGNDDSAAGRRPFFRPWKGRRYAEGFRGRKLLILGEAHYCYRDRDGQIVADLGRDFTADCVRARVAGVDPGTNFWRFIEKAVGGPAADPASFWPAVAFYNYVQRPIQHGPRVAPTRDMWADAAPAFLTILNRLRPDRLLVCGMRLWHHMPATARMIRPTLQVYRLTDGTSVPTLATVHPSSGR